MWVASMKLSTAAAALAMPAVLAVLLNLKTMACRTLQSECLARVQNHRLRRLTHQATGMLCWFIPHRQGSTNKTNLATP